jgi:hypothetical protein
MLNGQKTLHARWPAFSAKLPLPDDETFNVAWRRRRQVLGDAWVDKSLNNRTVSTVSSRR